MANYTSNLKTWGSTGQEFPDNYSYVEGEQPVDAWDNFITHNIFTDLDHLVSLTNDRLESGQGTSHPSSPESGELSLRTDSPEAGSGDQLFHRDDSSSTWHRLLKANGDSLTGDLNINNQSLVDSSGQLDIASGVDVELPLNIGGAGLADSWHSKQEGGIVTQGQLTPILTLNLGDGETLYVTQAMLTKDGFTEPADSGVSLSIVPESASSDGDTVHVLDGDGATLYDDETGSPIASYENTSGSAETVIVGLDNGHFNAGAGQDTSIYGGVIARKV